MLVVTLMAVGTSMAVAEINIALPSMKGDGAMRAAIAGFNLARELAQTQRRNMRVVFTAPHRIQIIRQDVPNGTTLVGSIDFEGGVEFGLTPGLPDTPDAFGKSSATDFGTTTAIYFTSEGELIDDQGVPVNGTIFMAIQGQPRSARAVTVLGATSRIRAYRWKGSSWEK